ncbi:hypothetical protein D3C78_1467990 [compost metagenome]
MDVRDGNLCDAIGYDVITAEPAKPHRPWRFQQAISSEVDGVFREFLIDRSSAVVDGVGFAAERCTNAVLSLGHAFFILHHIVRDADHSIDRCLECRLPDRG